MPVSPSSYLILTKQHHGLHIIRSKLVVRRMLILLYFAARCTVDPLILHPLPLGATRRDRPCVPRPCHKHPCCKSCTENRSRPPSPLTTAVLSPVHPSVCRRQGVNDLIVVFHHYLSVITHQTTSAPSIQPVLLSRWPLAMGLLQRPFPLLRFLGLGHVISACIISLFGILASSALLSHFEGLGSHSHPAR